MILDVLGTPTHIHIESSAIDFDKNISDTIIKKYRDSNVVENNTNPNNTNPNRVAPSRTTRGPFTQTPTQTPTPTQVPTPISIDKQKKTDELVNMPFYQVIQTQVSSHKFIPQLWARG